MKKQIFILILAGFLAFQVVAQVAPSNVQRINESPDQKSWDDARRHLDSLDSLNRKSNLRFDKPTTSDIRQTFAASIYRKSFFNELELLASANNYKNEFADFLQQENTGLVRLVKDLGCDEFSGKKQTSICQTFSMPGGGSAYSFRRKDYQLWKMSDIVYDGKVLFTFGEMSQGFLVNIGNVELVDVTKETKGANFVFAFVPKQNPAEFLEQSKQFIDGIEFGGVLYKKYLPLVVGETYLLRSIAYQGEVFREHNGFVFNELDFDNRRDVIVGFRVIEKDFNGTVTLLWKILQSKKSPKMKL